MESLFDAVAKYKGALEKDARRTCRYDQEERDRLSTMTKEELLEEYPDEDHRLCKEALIERILPLSSTLFDQAAFERDLRKNKYFQKLVRNHWLHAIRHIVTVSFSMYKASVPFDHEFFENFYQLLNRRCVSLMSFALSRSWELKNTTAITQYLSGHIVRKDIVNSIQNGLLHLLGIRRDLIFTHDWPHLLKAAKRVFCNWAVLYNLSNHAWDAYSDQFIYMVHTQGHAVDRSDFDWVDSEEAADALYHAYQHELFVCY